MRNVRQAFLWVMASFLATSPVPLVAQEDLVITFSRAFGLVADLRDALTESEALLATWTNELANAERSLEENGPDGLGFQKIRTAIDRNGLALNASEKCREVFRREDPEPGWEEEMALCVDAIEPAYSLREALECSSLHWETEHGGRVKLLGHVSRNEDLLYLRDKYGHETVNRVTQKPWPVCGAVKALELPMTSDDKPLLRLLSGSDQVAFNQSLGFQVQTPGFFSYLYVVYLQADGSVVNLTPRISQLRTQYPSKTIVPFGDGRDGRPNFTAAPPAGNEAIVAIAARSPIRMLEDLEGRDGQYWVATAGAAPGPITQGDFIALLEASMQGAAQGGFSSGSAALDASAQILHVTITP